MFKVVDGKAALTKVEIGNRQPGKVEIIKGLVANDIVVTEGQMKLQRWRPGHGDRAACARCRRTRPRRRAGTEQPAGQELAATATHREHTWFSQTFRSSARSWPR